MLKRGVAACCTGMFAVTGLIFIGTDVRADERLFNYSYEADSILPKGGVEFEQWVTYRGIKHKGNYSRWDLREEIEYGVTDRYTTALYLNTTSEHSDGVSGVDDTSDFKFKGISSEHKYQILNPNTGPFGLLLYGEVTTDGEELELEQKLVLSKHFGEKWTVALNAAIEEEWEFESEETEKALELQFSAGVAYRLNQHWSLGLEALHVREFEGLGFGDQESSAYFVGPNVHYGSGKWWATLSVMPQIDGHPNTHAGMDLVNQERLQVRLIFGINF
jgi:hypothetical protein